MTPIFFYFFIFYLWACMTPFDSLEKKKADQLVLPIYKCRFKLGRPRTFFQQIWSLLWLYHLLCVNHIGHVSTSHHYFINHSGLLGQVNRVARLSHMQPGTQKKDMYLLNSVVADFTPQAIFCLISITPLSFFIVLLQTRGDHGWGLGERSKLITIFVLFII